MVYLQLIGRLPRVFHGSLDEMFDMDRDGVLDINEQGFELEFLEEDDSDDDDDYDDEIDDALDSIGYTRDDLEFMDDDERAEILEEAGLDPDDWDW